MMVGQNDVKLGHHAQQNIMVTLGFFFNAGKTPTAVSPAGHSESANMTAESKVEACLGY